jgi:glycosyltransferase involved in cell wall biosynthesis
MSGTLNVRILCIFSGHRQVVLEAAQRGEGPKTFFFGLYPFLAGEDATYTASILPTHHFRAFKYLSHMKEADIILASYLSWMLVIGKIVFPRKQFIFYNIDLNSVISRASPFRKQAIRLKLFFINKIVCITHRQEDVLLSLGIPKSAICFVPFGVDQAYFTRELKKYPDTAPRVFFAVGADEARDYKTLLLAAAELPADRFLIECKDRNIPRDVKLPSNVTIMPMVAGKLSELVERYAHARAIIVPSLDEKKNVGSDCCGQTVLLEALACRKPVVASRRSWMQDYFSAEDPVFIFEPENSESLAEILEQTDFSNAVEDSFALKYTDERMTIEWRTLFQELSA